MANLFSIHTPFQLLVAQQIIIQENLSNNIFLRSMVGGNKEFFKAYELIKIPSLWTCMVDFPDISTCTDIPKWSFIGIRKNVEELFHIVRNNKVERVFFGDIESNSLQCLARFFRRKGYKVYFFEEGSSHYYKSFKKNDAISKKRWLWSIINRIIIRPLTKIDLLNVGRSNYDGLFSILPFIEDKRNVHLVVDLKLSEKILEFVDLELKDFDSASCNMLLMTEPIYLTETKNNYKTLLCVYEQFVKSIPINSTLWLKFHPRETAKFKEDLLRLLKDNNINYYLLGVNVNIPAEYYLCRKEFSEICGFMSSTFMYNTYIYKCEKIRSLYPVYMREISDAPSPHVVDVFNSLSKRLVPNLTEK